MIVPKSLVETNYRTIILTAVAWLCLGFDVNQATWLTA
jgi:hypothetical protein